MLTLLVLGCRDSISIDELRIYAPTESYPEDTYLSTVAEKRALVIGAHGDDDVIMAGTIAKLKADGWIIKRIMFRSEEPGDVSRMATSKIIHNGFEFIELGGKAYRNDMDTVQYPYMPIPKERFDQVFERQEIADELITKINRFQPTVIFTLDHEMGGYGHPDHIFISQLVLDLCEEKAIQPQKIYQGVYTDHMEEQIVEIRLTELVKKWGFPSPYMSAISMYNLPEGMPGPDVEVNIHDQAETKMAYIKSFNEEEQRTIGKFMPYYDAFDAQEYFRVFDREFFRVIEIR
ncbi:MAG: PIG-L family deacetylase [Flavobacteriales bacterium]|nr:PIG-L family deacetylase [Flavobacteriales bacterium]